MKDNSKLAAAVEAELTRLVTENEKWLYSVVRKMVRRHVEDEVRKVCESAEWQSRLNECVVRAMRGVDMEVIAAALQEKAVQKVQSYAPNEVYNLIRASNEFDDVITHAAQKGIHTLRQMRIDVRYE